MTSGTAFRLICLMANQVRLAPGFARSEVWRERRENGSKHKRPCGSHGFEYKSSARDSRHEPPRSQPPPRISCMERRRSPREPSGESAEIVHGLNKSISCVIRDLSSYGACLEVAPPTDTVSLPEQFLLFRPSSRSMRNCKVVWRSFQRVGVEFK